MYKVHAASAKQSTVDIDTSQDNNKLLEYGNLQTFLAKSDSTWN